MESYTSFAAVYDEFMDQTPYDQWYRNVQKIFKKYGVPEQGSILELGCGTGKMTRRLAAGGYDVTAVDASQEMLEIAKNSGDDGILYVLQDMAELELPGTPDRPLLEQNVRICGKRVSLDGYGFVIVRIGGR